VIQEFLDVYQMNAYSTGIKNVSKVILLYPRVSRSDHLVGYYTLLSSVGGPRPLEIKLIDLMECLSWNEFLKSFKRKRR
jgi:5-methylcytosine-specific restriction endonuclease McrBC regulatory subunit McrC